MATSKFRSPIVVYIAGPIGFTLIEPVQQVSDFLFEHWPGNDRMAWAGAMNRCAEDGGIDDTSTAPLPELKDAAISYGHMVEIYGHQH